MHEADFRAIEAAELMIKKNLTVRQVAKIMDYPKSTVHKDLTHRLPTVDEELFQKVKKVLMNNLNVRHIRGGEATKIKYMRGEN